MFTSGISVSNYSATHLQIRACPLTLSSHLFKHLNAVLSFPYSLLSEARICYRLQQYSYILTYKLCPRWCMQSPRCFFHKQLLINCYSVTCSIYLYLPIFPCHSTTNLSLHLNFVYVLSMDTGNCGHRLNEGGNNWRTGTLQIVFGCFQKMKFITRKISNVHIIFIYIIL